MVKIVSISWDKVISHVKTQLPLPGEPEIIYAVSKGGMVLATLISNFYKDKRIRIVENINYDAKDSKLEKASIYVDLIFTCDKRNILLVDDICSSGKTLDRFTKIKKCKTFAFGTRENSQYKPDYTCVSIPKDVWIEFPWEAF